MIHTIMYKTTFAADMLVKKCKNCMSCLFDRNSDGIVMIFLYNCMVKTLQYEKHFPFNDSCTHCAAGM